MKPETIALIKQIVFGVLLLVLTAGVLYATYQLTRLEALTIDAVTVSGGETLPLGALQSQVEAELEGEYLFGLWPRRFVWTYPERDIKAALAEVERISDIAIARSGRTIAVALTESDPHALWCDSVASSSDCVFIDQAGVAFARAPELSGALYTRYVETGRTASVTEQFATTSTFAFLEDTHDTLERELNWRVRQFKVDQVGDVSVYLSGGSELLIAQTIPPTELVNAIRSVQSAPQYDDLTPGNFAYIDLRFGDKVFVSESGPPTDTDVATSTATTTANTTATTSQPETE